MQTKGEFLNAPLAFRNAPYYWRWFRVKRIYRILALLVIPVLVHLLLKLTSMETVMTAAVLIYCMPCGANTIVFAKMTGQDCRTGASLSLISTVLSVITIPLCVYFLIG